MEDRLYVRKIREGTVIDHIPAGRALVVLRILGLTGHEGFRIAVVMNVESSRMGVKDIVKIEKLFLDEEQVNKISLVAPNATVNVVKDYRVVRKYKVEPPSMIEGIIHCTNPTCISRKDREPLKPRFRLISKQPIKLQCIYCSTIIGEKEVLEQLIESS